MHGTVSLFVDEVEIARRERGGFEIVHEYANFDATPGAPPLIVETRLDDTVIDALELRPGFCTETCRRFSCSGLGWLRLEEVNIGITVEGVLTDWRDTSGCRRCEGVLSGILGCD
jgi:hypothetical protein